MGKACIGLSERVNVRQDGRRVDPEMLPSPDLGNSRIMEACVPPVPSGDPPCKKVLALLTPVPEWEAALCDELEAAFGPLDYRGQFLPFDGTDYYAAEMGAPLFRGCASFRGLGGPQDLPDWKWKAREIEAHWTVDGKRTRNLDIGYLDPDKLVLASFKRGPWKLYLGRGVWADMILGYACGVFTPTARAFADFRDGRYNKAFIAMREKLKAEMGR